MNAKGGCEHDVKNRIQASWLKRKDLADVLCDAKISKRKSIHDNDETDAGVWSTGLDSDNKRGRATGENRNENAALDTWSLAEG